MIYRFPQPEWNDAGSIDRALVEVAAIRGKSDVDRLGWRLHDAIGNTHCMSYFPVVLEVMPALATLLREGQEWVRYFVIEYVLDICLGGFPERGYEAFAPVEGGEKTLLGCRLLEAARELIPDLETVAAGSDAGASSAKELLEFLRSD